jgi:anti-sigma B factor antagonist
MRQLARIVAETHDEVPVARLEGEVDMTNAESLGERLRRLLTNRSVALIVDLGPTTYLDSSGITLLFGLADELRLRQQRLHVVVPQDSPIARVISITGLDQATPTHSTLENALKAAA